MRLLGLGICLILMACGGSSEVEQSQVVAQIIAKPAIKGLYLDELSAGQWSQTCEWMVGVQGGSRTVDCRNGMMATVESVATCENRNFRPHCPAASLVACVDSRGTAICGDETLECIKYYQCVRSSRPVVTALHTNL